MTGIDCKLYVNTGTFGTPDWVEASLVGDAQANIKGAEASANVRGSVVEVADVTGFQIEITGNIRVKETDEAFGALDTAFHARAEVDVMALRGGMAVNGVKGYRLPCKVFDWSEDQGRANALYKAFMLKPCPSDNPCQTVAVTSGAPVFTDLAA